MDSFKNTFRLSISLIFTFLVMIGCSPRKPVDRSGYSKEKEVRELKRLTSAELMVKGEELGKMILAAAADTLQSSLKRAIVENGVDGAIQFCNVHATGLVSDLEDSLGVSIMRVTNNPRNPKDSLTNIDRDIWEAYAYASSNEAQLQELDDQTLILTKPIMISTGLCLNCHGEPGNTITSENYDLIKSKYPNDQAINYQVGDLRGMWRIIIPKKSVVSRL